MSTKLDDKNSMNFSNAGFSETLENFEKRNKNLRASNKFKDWKSKDAIGFEVGQNLQFNNAIDNSNSKSQSQVPNNINNKSGVKTQKSRRNKLDNKKTKDVNSMSLNNIKSEKAKMNEIAGSPEIKFDGAKFHSKGIVAILLVFVLSIFTIGSMIVAGNFNGGTTLTANATNTRIVQAKLSSLGYYDKEIDGIYDKDTIDAIKSYQADKNLAVTGSLDSATTAALGVTDNAQANSDLYLLAKLIYSEARGEIYQGQVAVGAVVLNRVADAGFPNTLQGVIYQPWAFTALHDGQFSLEPNSTAYSAAQDAMNGWDPTYGCLYYYNPKTATSSWIFSRTIAVTIGNHVFCY